MKPVLTASEYGRVDRAYEGDLAQAMDRAGHAVALAAVRAGAGYGSRVVVLAGPGNNGGDGYVAARYLRRRGVHVVVHAMAPPSTPLAVNAANEAKALGVPVVEIGTPSSADVVVDALLGGGARRGLPSEVLEWIDTDAAVVAVDFPTGVDPDTGKVAQQAFVATETVTFGAMKTGHVRGDGPEYCGRVTVADIGVSGGRPSMFIAEEVDAILPSRPRRAHKWSAGAVLIVGGSVGMIGAAILAGRSALNFGAGTVYLVTPEADLAQRVAPEIPAYDLSQAERDIDRFDVVVAGPGMASDDAEAVRPLLSKAGRLVLDAGALTPPTLAVAREGGADVVITPHDAEFERIAGVGAGSFSIRSFATREQITVVRKGNPTMISEGGPPVLVTTGGPELATIGTGDVLAGMIGALWARGLDATSAAISAVYRHGLAGSELARDRTVTADALVDQVAGHAW